MKKFLMVIGGIVAGIIVILVGIYAYISLTSEKLVCKSSDGNITIMYNDSKLTGYTTSGIQYDFKSQKSYASKTGTEEYIKEFKNWFTSNTDGSCETK